MSRSAPRSSTARRPTRSAPCRSCPGPRAEGAVSFFAFPDDARWNPDTEAVEFTVSLGEYQGTVRVGHVLFRRFLGRAVSPETCIEAYHLHRTRFERAVEEKL